MSSEMAWRAASLMAAGAAKSGNPCDRFTAWCFMASRGISRMTDSVNCSAFADIIRREISAILISAELIFLRLEEHQMPLRDRASGHNCRLRTGWINHPVHGGIAQHDLHVIASL